ncbi:MAG: peptidoglycan-associated lipoprotein [Nitrospirae bacterium]|nr:MAG: peptidoglycan-associated lipoprotein [Nitrospirota bacterium]
MRSITAWSGCSALALGLLFALSACSTKETSSRTTQQTIDQTEKAPPLQGFSKTPSEEVVQAPPTVTAKADQGEIALRQAREALKRARGDVYFEFDRWALTNEGKKNLAESAAALKQNPSVKILVEGHCDERGTIEYNLVLGEKRAQETRRYLQTLGVTNPVGVTSYGKERPVCTEHDESCYWKNRRAHLAVEEGKGK